MEDANIEFTEGADEKFEVKFPPTNDPEGTKVTLEVTSSLPSFISFKKGSSELILTSPLKVGDYVVDILLTDADEKSSSWKQKIFIAKKEEVENE